MFDPAAVQVRRLENGVTLLTERIPTVRSASVGVWIKRGSRDEAAEANGVAHFVEHMLFKGAGERTTQEIAYEIDSLGGAVDAFTAHEMSGYTAQVLDENLPKAFALLADLTTRPRFDPEEFEREREVILEEIAGAEDDPEDLLFESFQRRFWEGHALGRPILGTRESVASMGYEDLRRWMDGLGPEDVVVAAAGNLVHEDVAELVMDRLGDLRNRGRLADREAPTTVPHIGPIARDLEQVHLYVAAPGPAIRDENRYAANLLNTLLGGGVSSRLFQEIRERRGLAYSVYSSLASYTDTGYVWVGAGSRPRTAATVIELIEHELRRLCDAEVPAEELERTKQQVKGALMLSLESTFARMANLARQEIGFGRTFTLDEILAAIDGVTVDDIQLAARRLFDVPLSAGCVGAAATVERLQKSLDANPAFAS